MANLFSLEGKNAWITGASYGIGFNIAKAFVAAGAKTIIFNDINEAALQRGLADVVEDDVLDARLDKRLGDVETDSVRSAGDPGVLAFEGKEVCHILIGLIIRFRPQR